MSLDAAGVAAEVARLGALPEGTLPADLGAAAEAKVACATRLLADRVSGPARAAAARLFVIQFATERQIASPLIGPQFLAAGDGERREALQRLMDTGIARDGDDADLATAVKAYRAISRPLYLGLDLENTSWAQADLERILLAAGTDRESLRNCYRARVGG